MRVYVRFRDAAGNTTDEAVTSTSIVLDTQNPTSPAPLEATSSKMQASLRWVASSDANFDGYRLYRKDNGTTSYPATPVKTFGAFTTSYVDTTCRNSAYYDYKIEAWDKAGRFTYAEVFSVYTG
jgi:fibronectin type 3 domain-containing protein